jgi:glutamyl-tRNA synthetase
MADAAHYFYATPHVPAEKLAEFVTAGNRPALAELYEAFAALPWSRESIGAALKSGATKHGLKPPQIMMALRMIATGTRETPAIDAVLALLGRDITRARMKAGLAL